MNFSKPKFWDINKISLFSLLLFPISLLIRLLILLKIFFSKKVTPPVPTICIGNIYLGGTGKTPLSIEIFSILINMNMRPAFIKKKYEYLYDEVMLQKQIGPVYESKKRIKAIEEAIQNNINVVILDDGFQDFSLKKNLSIVCFNEKQWVGNGLTIPSGPLRESLSALKRAECIMINGKKNIEIEKKIFSYNKDIKIFYSKYIPENINSFKNKKVIAFAGIGNPENFFILLKDNKIDIVEEINFPDHHKYFKKELDYLVKRANESNAILLTTEKDYHRLDEFYKKNVYFLKIKTEIENKNKFIEEIKKIYENN